MRPSELDPERWRKIDRIFEAVLDAPTAERDRILTEGCEGDPDLRAEVEALLEASERSDTRLDVPVSGLAGEILAAPGADPPRRLGRFRILREIGRGGMGVVYLAEDTRLGRYVALKALPPYLGAGRHARRRFEREARAVSALDHPNIATLHEIDETADGQLFMVFAYYEGETLAGRIRRGPPELAEALDIAIGIGEGLRAAHASRIIHRDVKPSNVLLTGGGGVKLLDFGVAKVAGEELTGEGVRLGTVAYMSPEQCGDGPIDERADLWSLGVVLYEMLTGTRPFRGSDPPSMLRAVLYDPPDPAPAGAKGLAGPVEQVVLRLLSKDPDRRYRRAEDLLVDLRAVRHGGVPEVAVRDPPPTDPGRIKRLAVLPLRNLTGDPEAEPLIRGIHDSLIAELGMVRALDVLSRTSVLPFHDAAPSIPEIAGLLEVDAVVAGSVGRAGEDLTITTRLVGIRPERQLWQETYRRSVRAVPALAAEVARSIAAVIDVPLSPSEEARLGSSRSVDPAAWEALTLGQFHLERRSPEGHDLAQKYLRRAVELDPELAPAYAALAEAHGSATFFGLNSPAEGLPVVRDLVRKALDLDATLPAAHASLGAVRLFGDWDWSGAEAALRRAISLNPSFAYAYFLLADVLSVQGRYREALAAAERNTALERFVPFSAFGPVIVLYHSGDFDRAIEQARAGVDFFTEFWQGYWLLGLSLAGKGLPEQAIASLEAAVDRSRRTPIALGALGMACGRAGRRPDAEKALAELVERSGTEYVGGSNLAIIQAALGAVDQAFQSLELAYRQRDMALIHLADDVSFDQLRADRRFHGLSERVGVGGREPR